MTRAPIIRIGLDQDEIIVDSFAGGGGASEGIRMALGRDPDIAINHDAEAIALHRANHPGTTHFTENVWKVDPKTATGGKPVGLMWLSPDCKHFSKAKGGKPVSKKIRGLAWIAIRWAAAVKPRIIILENVEEFQGWGPVLADGKPCPVRKGKTFRAFVRKLERHGYVVDWKELRACDFGAPTIRKRLFLIARCDGQPIIWPAATHGKHHAQPWRTAAECIDWAIPCPSIFARAKPLAENTLKRIARGLQRFVIDADRPFIVNVANGGTTGRGPNVWSIEEPLRTQTASPSFAVAQPFVVNMAHGGKLESIDEPISTIATEKGGCRALVSPFVAPLTHHGALRGQAVDEPLATVTGAHRGEQAIIAPLLVGTGGPSFSGKPVAADVPMGTLTTENHRAVVAAHLTHFHGNATGSAADAPMPTITANSFVKRPGGSAPIGVVGAFLKPRYGEREGQEMRARSIEDPMPTVVPTGNGGDLVTAFLAQNNTGNVGHAPEEPLSTIVGKGCTQSIVASTLVNMRGTRDDQLRGQSLDEPLPTISGGGIHAAEVRAFMVAYYGNEKDGASLFDPMRTVTSKDRLGLVTVDGVEFAIADIGLRMLAPRELYNAQGFRRGYEIDIQFNGKPLTKTAQVRMVGNSVCPPMARALVLANVGVAAEEEAAA